MWIVIKTFTEWYENSILPCLINIIFLQTLDSSVLFFITQFTSTAISVFCDKVITDKGEMLMAQYDILINSTAEKI